MKTKAIKQVRSSGETSFERETILRKGVSWAAIIGVDGSGKSTVLRRLQERSGELPFKGIEILHRRPGYVYQSQKSGTGEITHYNKPNHGSFKSVLKIAAMVLDWEVGYWTFIRRRWDKGYYVIADRHSVLDMLADPDRYRYGGPSGLINLALKLAPIPPFIFLLDAPIEVLVARKQELDRTKLIELRNSYQNIFKSWPGSIYLDASRPVDDIVSEMVKTIAEGVKARREVSLA